MSGVDFEGRSVRKGAADAVRRWVEEQGGDVPDELGDTVDSIAAQGGTPLVVAEAGARTDPRLRALGVIYLKDIVKPGIAERFADLRRMGIRTVMITGDNPRTAAFIAKEAGVDDFLAEATPEDKMALIREEQAGGRLVAMTGDGTNDAPALAQADVARGHEHRHPGGQGSREHGRPRLRPDQAHRHRRDRQAAAHHPRLADDVLDRQRRGQVLRHHPGDVRRVRQPRACSTGSTSWTCDTPRSAILSAVIFNALIIVALVPLALRGVKFRAANASALLRRNLLIYGAGGIVAPFIGIKLIDLLITALGVK